MSPRMKPAPLHIEDATVLLDAPGIIRLEQRPLIEHSVKARTAHGFVDSEGYYSQVPFLHTFTAAIPLDSPYGDSPLENEEDTSAVVTRLIEGGYEVRNSHGGFEHTKEVVVGEISAGVFASRHKSYNRTSWLEWLDSIDGDVAWAGFFADSLEEREDYEGELNGGALIHVYNVAVHPRFRGQDVGLRLVVHALLTLSHGLYDVATLIATDSPTQWDTREPEPTPVRARKLAKHYERLGFSQVGPSDDGSMILMYFPVGSYRLNIADDLQF